MENKERHRIIPSAYVILKQDEKVLLQLRANTGYEDGNYGLVAGHVEAGETFTEGIMREAKEEAGIDLLPEHLQVVHFMHRGSKRGDDERGDVFFVAKQWGGEVQNMEPHKCDELRWFTMDELPDNVIPYIREALQCVESGIFYSEYDW